METSVDFSMQGFVYFIPTITAKHKNTKVFIIPNIVLYNIINKSKSKDSK